MVAGRDKTGMPACMLRAAWQTWLGPRASPVDRSVIGSAPDDVLPSDPGLGRHTIIAVDRLYSRAYSSPEHWSSLFSTQLWILPHD